MLIKDSDPIVVQNALVALNEVMVEEGGMALNAKIIIYLLNKLKEFNEWGQAIVLDLVARYSPKNEAETLDIMNLLADRLRLSSFPVVLATIKIFINYSLASPAVYDQVLEKVQGPLMTLCATGYVTNNHELYYLALCHINNLVQNGGAKYFEKDYKKFYLRVDDAPYNKIAKLEILTYIAGSHNISDILGECSEYVNDADKIISCRAIRAIGQVAEKNKDHVVSAAKLLTSLLLTSKEHIVNECLVAMRGKLLFNGEMDCLVDIMRKTGKEFKDFLVNFPNFLDSITSPEALSALAWICNNFSASIDDCSYILEKMISKLKESDPPHVKLSVFSK
jgi:AP-4 complex subunit beta-1